jgi:hypothetical protein
MWLETRDGTLYNLEFVLSIKVFCDELTPKKKWSLKIPYEAGHPNLETYETKEEAQADQALIANILMLPASKRPGVYKLGGSK